MNSGHSDIKELRDFVVGPLLYYDIFNYPLTSKEVFQFINTNRIKEKELALTLDQMCIEGSIYKFDQFYTLQNDEGLISRRIKGNEAAKHFLTLAKKKGHLIAAFPFVRAVLASGSLSKNYIDENSDLDFFIITEPGRLWIARILLVMYKRIFLFNSHKYFCVNYFVDTDHLEIEEKNLFTATELATVIPLYGAAHYKKLHVSNAWLKDFFPNHTQRSCDGVPDAKQSILKKTMEWFVNLMFADHLDHFFKSVTLRRWKKLYQRDYPTADFQVAFKSKDYASKNHPKNYQRKVMELYEEKLKKVHGPQSIVDS